MMNGYQHQNYTVIIGDLIDSKKIQNRQSVQKKFKRTLDEINEKYASDIAATFSISLGDECQGLLKNRNNIIKIVFDIEMAMYPIALRFGIGIGAITTDINVENSLEIDGPSYHRARAMLEKMKSQKNQYVKRKATILISTQDENGETDKLLNSILSVCTALKSKWTPRQTEIIEFYLRNDENQYKAAEKLGIGQSSVNKALSSADFYTYRSAMDTVNCFLGEEGMD